MIIYTGPNDQTKPEPEPLPNVMLEDFEADKLNHWWEDITTSGKWSRITGPTPTSGTGANSAYSGDSYYYTEASGTGNTNKDFVLRSKLLRIYTKADLSFRYHMYANENFNSSDLGDLSVYINDWPDQRNREPVWTGRQQENENDEWKEVRFLYKR